MSDRISRKIQVQDDAGGVESAAADADLELVSTQMLKVMLTSPDDGELQAIRDTARIDADGVLARHAANGRFEIIDEAVLREILDARGDTRAVMQPADATLGPLRDYVVEGSLSLVSARALRRALGSDHRESDASEDAAASDELAPVD